MKFNVGDKVQINIPQHAFHKRIGFIRQIEVIMDWNTDKLIKIEFDDGWWLQANLSSNFLIHNIEYNDVLKDML